MFNLKMALLAALLATTAWFIWAWWSEAQKKKGEVPGEKRHTWYHSIVAFVMCFFDTLGVGNFATTTAAFKFRNSVPDEIIPGTLNVGYVMQTVAQALIYISIIEVDVWTLVLMIAAAVAGAWLGAGIVSHWPRRTIQIGMGCCLLGASLVIALQIVGNYAAAAEFIVRHVPALQGAVAQIQHLFSGGQAQALVGARLGLGLVGNFLLGALMTLGIGLYAPCLMMVSLLGMNPATAFPIMMGSCAFLMPVGGIRFIKAGRYAPWTSVVMSIAGIPAVLIAAYIVRQLQVNQVRMLVFFVVIYTATMMLRSAISEKRATAGRMPDSGSGTAN
jgi:uncharacterized membrane protein YfcA